MRVVVFGTLFLLQACAHQPPSQPVIAQTQIEEELPAWLEYGTGVVEENGKRFFQGVGAAPLESPDRQARAETMAKEALRRLRWSFIVELTRGGHCDCTEEHEEPPENVLLRTVAREHVKALPPDGTVFDSYVWQKEGRLHVVVRRDADELATEIAAKLESNDRAHELFRALFPNTFYLLQKEEMKRSDR